MSWEDKFRSWSQPPSKTELEKCDNAERAIKRASRDDERLSKLDIRVFVQGSYRERTNIRQDSDVDICVSLQQPFFSDYPPGKTREDFGLVAGSITFQAFKQLVETALINEFGKKSVNRGNKAFDVHENTYRIDADVVPAFTYRWYTGGVNRDRTYQYVEPTGIKFFFDKGGSVINWPEQSYANGADKNEKTGKRYKGVIRILKRLRNEMQEAQITEADTIASFLIESLVWNTPNDLFGHDSLADEVKYILAHCYNYTRDDEKCKEWGEVNKLKYLFRASQPWTRVQANSFLLAAWKYIGF